MNNDFNTAQALSACFNLADKIFQVTSNDDDNDKKDNLACLLAFYLKVLGFSLSDTRKLVGPETGKLILDLMVDLRQEARTRKDYATSDLIRGRLSECGISMMDNQSGKTDWELD